MTISITDSTCTHTGNGATVNFSVSNGGNGIYFAAASELTVTLRSGGMITAQTLGVHYTVAGAGSAAGIVTFVTAPANGIEVHIERNTPMTQAVALTNGGPFSPSVVEAAVDKLTRITQDLQRSAGGAVSVEAAAASAAAAAASQTAAAASAATAASLSVNPSFQFKWSTNTAASDPGSTYVKGNNATLASVTTLYLSETSVDGSVGTALAALMASISANKATIYLIQATDRTKYLIGTVTADTDSGTYRTIAITVTATGSGAFTADASLSVLIVPIGELPGSIGTGNLGDDIVTNAKLANMATATLKGRTTAGTGDPEDLTAAQAVALLGLPEVLSADRTYYVRTDGSDSNTGLVNNAGGAFLTVQKGIDVAAALDSRTYTVTIQIADGTYNTGLGLNAKSATGQGRIIIKGNESTPANVVLHCDTTSSQAVGFAVRQVLKRYEIRAVKLTAAASAYFPFGLTAEMGSTLDFANIDFGSGWSHQIWADAFGTIRCIGNYAITSGASAHLVANNGYVVVSNYTVTLTGTPVFSSSFAYAYQCGTIVSSGCTFSGSATGVRYNALINGVINTVGSGANYFPGNSAGSTSFGGQYV